MPFRSPRVYTEAKLAEMVGLDRGRLRYLRRIGLVHASRPRGVDAPVLYGAMDLLRMQQVRIGLSRGFSFEDMRRHFESDLAPGAWPPPPSLEQRFRARARWLNERDSSRAQRALQCEFRQERSRWSLTLCAAVEQGRPPMDPTVQAAMVVFRQHLERWFCSLSLVSLLEASWQYSRVPTLMHGCERVGPGVGDYLIAAAFLPKSSSQARPGATATRCETREGACCPRGPSAA